MPDESRIEREQDPNPVNGDHEDDPPSDADKSAGDDEILEKADADTTKDMVFE